MDRRLTAHNADGSIFLIKTKADENAVLNDAIQKLAYYEDAKEKGGLIELPFEIGAKFYYVNKFGVYEYTVVGYELRDDGLDIISDDGQRFEEPFLNGANKEFICRTREEAETKQKELEKNNGH